MKRYGLIPSIKDLFETIKPMPMKEKVKHILTSYTDLVFVFGICFVLLVMTVSSFLFPGPQNILEGAVFNVGFSDAGIADITSDFAQMIEPDTNNKTVVVNKYSFQYVTPPEGDNFDSMEDMQDANNTINLMKQIAMLVSAKRLDFLIADRSSMEYLNDQELCVDMSQFLTEDMFALVKDRLVYMETGEDQVLTPVAVDISGTAFAKAFISSKNTCISFVQNTTRPDNCRSFLEYVLNWSEETNN